MKCSFLINKMNNYNIVNILEEIKYKNIKYYNLLFFVKFLKIILVTNLKMNKK